MNRIMTDRSRAPPANESSNASTRSNFPDDLSQPMFRAANIHFEIAERAVGTPYGGIGLIHQLVKMLDLPATTDERLHFVQVPPAVSRVGPRAQHCLQRPVRWASVACKIWNCDGQGRSLPQRTSAPHAFPTPPRRVTSVAALRRIIWMLCRSAIDFTRREGLGQSARPVFRTGDSRRRWHNGRNRWRVQTGNGHFLERPVGDTTRW